MKMTQAEFEAQLAEIRKAYIASLEDKRDVIINNWSALSRQWDNAIYESLYLVVHGLAGSALTFELEQITHDARCVIQLLKQQAGQESLPQASIGSTQASIEKLISAINQALAEESI